MTGLAALVQDTLAMDPFSTQLFVFANRRRTQCRILYWERCGFVLWQKRLERARFAWPRPSEKLPDGQLGLFNEAEASAAQEPESPPATEVAAHRRATPKRAPLPDALARSGSPSRALCS